MLNLAQPLRSGRIRVATLGPAGTCSHATALGMLWALGESSAAADNDVLLRGTFEDAVKDVLAGVADVALIPAAYKHYNEISFRNVEDLQVVGVVTSPTPVFVLASRRRTSEPREGPTRIASHPSPAPLLDRVSGNLVHVEAMSNAAAAWMVANEEADICVTNRFAVGVVNGAVEPGSKLVELQVFGSVEMVWSVFARKQAAVPVFLLSLGLEHFASEGGGK